METYDEDKFPYAETQSVRSSQSQIDTPHDLMRIIEENYQRFNDIIDQSAPVDNNLEKELAKEDKKCTFLQYKIENLKKRYYDAKEISGVLQNSVRDQQMEIEKVSAVIYEQFQQLNVKFPSDGLSHYSDAVSIISDANEWVKNLKNVLQLDLEEYEKKTANIFLQKQAIAFVINRIQNLIAEKQELEKNLKLRINSITKPDFDSFKTHLSLLNEKYNEYQNLKAELNAKKVQLKEFKKKEAEVFNECQKINQILAESSNKYKEITTLFRKQYNDLKIEQVEFENVCQESMNDLDSMLTQLAQEMKIMDDEINIKKREREELAAKKLTRKSEKFGTLSQMEQLQLEYSKIEKCITSCREQENMLMNMKQIMQKQIDVLKKTNAQCKFLLKQLIQEAKTVEQEHNSSVIRLENSSLENLQETINEEQVRLECDLLNRHKINDEISELNEIVTNFTEKNNKLKSDMKLCETERNFHERILEKTEKEYHENREKQLATVLEGVNNAVKDTTNAFSSTFEKQLLIDIFQDDIREYTKLSSEMQQKVWAVNQKNENLRTEMFQLQDTVSKENVALEGKKKLLKDLERNSFPKNKIPITWFKSFEKQKQDYDLLVKQRLELEKQRNKLIMEIDNQSFQESRSESANDIESPKSSVFDVKNAMYDMFKERVRKRRSTSLKP